MSLNQPDIKELRSIVDWVNLSEDVREVSLKFGNVELFISRDRQQPVETPAAQLPTYPGEARQGTDTTTTVETEPAPQLSVATPAAPTVPVTGGPSPLGSLADDEELIKAPMVGVFYASPKPGDPPFVQVGDNVGVGTVLGIVEVMKLMSNIEAQFAGTVTRILVDNEEAVEYGQPLLVIKRNG